MVINIKDKVIVVTGSSKGIGAKIIQALSLEGAKIVLNYNKSVDSANNIYRNIVRYNKNCIMVKSDITKASDVERLYHDTIEAFGRVDVLINNAGICIDNRIQLMTEEQWDQVINVNLKGAFLCSKVFSKGMIKNNGGKIINIASLKGQEGYLGQVNYVASKAGLIGFTKALAMELGAFNISVNSLCPGFIVTDLNRHNDDKKKIADNKSVIKVDHALSDLMNFVIYLSSDCCSGISGRVFNLDSRIM